MMPSTTLPSSKAFSRCVQVRARIAFSRDSRVSPKPSSTASSATSISSPTETDFGFAFLVQELFDGDDGLGLETGSDDDDIVVYRDNGAGDDGTRLDVLTGETLFK